MIFLPCCLGADFVASFHLKSTSASKNLITQFMPDIYIETFYNVPQYVHKMSNHPHKLLENVPQNIHQRLSSLSSNGHLINNATKPTKKP